MFGLNTLELQQLNCVVIDGQIYTYSGSAVSVGQLDVINSYKFQEHLLLQMPFNK